MARTRKSASATPAAKPAFTFTTHNPVVRFLRADGTLDGEGARAVRRHKATGTFCVARKGRLLPLERVEGDVAYVRLSAEPVASLSGVDAQDIAPVYTMADLGVAKATVPAGKPEDVKAPSAPAAAPVGGAVEARFAKLEANMEAIMNALAMLTGANKPA